MLILIDCRPLLSDHFNEEKSHFVFSCAAKLSKERGVEWLFLPDKRYRGGLPAYIPSAKLLTRKVLLFPTGWRFWYDWELSRTIKKHKPDLVMTSYGGTYQKRLPRSLKKKQALFCFSEKEKSFLSSAGRISAEKIIVMQPAADEGYGPLPGDEKENVKKDYAAGKEYFLTIVSKSRPDELVELLKAFSMFKKRQRSNMQLVLAGAGYDRCNSGWGSSAGRSIARGLGLDSYKYRSSIHIVDNPGKEELIRLVAASYAFISPFSSGAPGMAILNAWAAGSPVITNNRACLPEIGADAVLYVEPGDPVSLADSLMRVYKDESLRAGLIEKGRLRLPSFSREGAAARIWEGILRAMS